MAKVNDESLQRVHGGSDEIVDEFSEWGPGNLMVAPSYTDDAVYSELSGYSQPLALYDGGYGVEWPALTEYEWPRTILDDDIAMAEQLGISPRPARAEYWDL